MSKSSMGILGLLVRCLPACCRWDGMGSHVVWPGSGVPVLCAKARKMSAEEQRNPRRYAAAPVEQRERARERGSMKAERKTSTKPHCTAGCVSPSNAKCPVSGCVYPASWHGILWSPVRAFTQPLRRSKVMAFRRFNTVCNGSQPFDLGWIQGKWSY